MTSPRDRKDDEYAALLERLMETPQESVPTSAAGRLGRVAGMMARTAAAIGWRRLSGGASDEKAFEQLVRSLGKLKGVSMKAGQMMSYVDESLPPEARRMLATLQTHSPPMPFARIAAVVREDLPATGAALVERMEKKPVAAASIGQVHRATLPDGARVAVKVQYPGLRQALTSEFRAAGAGIQVARAVMPGGNFEAFIDEARERILAECDYAQEMAWQRRFREIYEGHPVLRVPEVFPDYSGERVLTSAWEDGLRLDEWLEGEPSRKERNRIGEALYELYIGTLLRHGLFNADPHPGNYLFRSDGALVVLDYGCVRSFAPERVRAFVALRDAVQDDDREAIRGALRGMGAKDPGEGARFDTARSLLRAFFAPTLEDRVQAMTPFSQTGFGQLFADKKAIAELNLPGELLFLFRIRFGLHAVLARIGAEANWRQLERGFEKYKLVV